MTRRGDFLLALAMGLLVLCACASVRQAPAEKTAQPQTPVGQMETAQETEPLPPRKIEAELVGGQDGASDSDSGQDAVQSAPDVAAEAKRCVVIDPGHQETANAALEPVGPGASEQKAKVAQGTTGVTSGTCEYELTLEIAFLLRDELERRGYEALLTRESHDVDISNAERAQLANDAHADAFLRIHANGADTDSANGAMTICQTAQNPYNGALYDSSYALSVCVLDALTEAAGCRKEYVWQTDTMAGINWAQMPVTIVEVGYMTNPEEDALLATEEYRRKIATGIADGVERFFAEQETEQTTQN